MSLWACGDESCLDFNERSIAQNESNGVILRRLPAASRHKINGLKRKIDHICTLSDREYSVSFDFSISHNGGGCRQKNQMRNVCVLAEESQRVRGVRF